ncbi:uncharacterized protein ISCGN_010150 [Ixodes scapularis]
MLLTGAPSCVARVNSRLLQIKPPHCVTRLPRSLNERSFWKASEWRLWLLFYALPCLVDILPLEYWKHLSKLSQAIHILLRETITADEIKRAENLLIDFVGRCEALYGVASLTFNVHQLLHLPNSVDICKVLKPEDIKDNCLFMVFPADSKCFVCDMPNKIERD